ncbi:30S ribosome-binding factor RbfA [Anaerorhabdus sp.]|uniref:Ribosome-binding factor A n=1 Tax=bioreactor metagenome TaxID=1076179 RepID=A0A645F618_9ZZZZ|nr:30S ribosome-binding factor RbfA [Anaerorhabdus sp.]MEA4875071.1 30S ribosome-binding factor RbfA [Anaerorhabdus sp.]
MKVKQERINQIVLKEVSDIIQFTLKDPTIGFITITDVQVTNDYSYATIYVSFLGKQERNEAGMKALNRAKGFIRSELAKRLTIRKVPDLIFKLDDTLNKSRKIDAILQEIHKNDEKVSK